MTTAAATLSPTSSTQPLDPVPPAVVAVAGPPPYRMTFEFSQRLAASELIGEKEPVYLGRGPLVQKMTVGRPLYIAANDLAKRLERCVPVGWYVGTKQAIALNPKSLPVPDVSVVRGKLRDYPKRHPTPADVGLLVEVSDSSLSGDEDDKQRRYAAASIAAYWIVNLPGRCIDVYAQPTGPSYADHQTYGPDDAVPVLLDGVEVGRVPVREVLP